MGIRTGKTLSAFLWCVWRSPSVLRNCPGRWPGWLWDRWLQSKISTNTACLCGDRHRRFTFRLIFRHKSHQISRLTLWLRRIPHFSRFVGKTHRKGRNMGDCTRLENTNPLSSMNQNKLRTEALLQCLDSCYFFDYIIIDEVHTRDSLIDLLLAVVSTQLKRYKVILMSAAMDKNHMKEYFERQLSSKDVTLMDLEAQVMRSHPIQEVFLSGESEENGINEINGSVSHLPQVPQHLNQTTWEQVFQSGRSGGIHWPDLAALIVARAQNSCFGNE